MVSKAGAGGTFFISPQAFFTIFFRFASIFRPKKKLYSKLYACANPPKVPLQAACEAFYLFDGYRTFLSLKTQTCSVIERENKAVKSVD